MSTHTTENKLGTSLTKETVSPFDDGDSAIDSTPLAAVNVASREMPHYTSKKRLQWLQHELLCLCRYIAEFPSSIDAAGLISVRDPTGTNRFWVNPWDESFSTVQQHQLVCVDSRGTRVAGSKSTVNLTMFQLHAALFAESPDVECIVQLGGRYAETFSSLGRPLEMLSQDACLFLNDHVIYDEYPGATLTGDQAASVARTLGKRRSLLLQNHGAVTVGGSVGEAAYLFVRLEAACQQQLAALATQQPRKLIRLSAAEAAYRVLAHPETLWAEMRNDLKYAQRKSPVQIYQTTRTQWYVMGFLITTVTGVMVFVIVFLAVYSSKHPSRRNR